MTNPLLNPYYYLLENLKFHLRKNNPDLDSLVYRISMTQDLDRVKQHGSSRVGLSDKDWDKLSLFKPEQLPVYPIKHEDVVIASEIADLDWDVMQEKGTLKHKLEIYEKPFFTVYHKDALTYLHKEDSSNMQNQGIHWLFNKDKKEAIHSLWQIHPKFYVTRIDL